MDIASNSLVLYKNGLARVAAIGDKLDIELEDGRSLRVLVMLLDEMFEQLDQSTIVTAKTDISYDIIR
ncbi:MAG: hypothetical protein WAT67_04925 [Candidatus Contendobacter sp.]